MAEEIPDPISRRRRAAEADPLAAALQRADARNAPETFPRGRSGARAQAHHSSRPARAGCSSRSSFSPSLLVPAIQLAVELRSPRPSGGLATFDLYNAYPAWEKIRAVRSAADAWNLLPRAEELKDAEKAIESDSVVSAWLLPHVQSVLTGKLGAGNEQVYLGRDGWLFYRPDVDYVTGPPFLDPTQLRHRARSRGSTRSGQGDRRLSRSTRGARDRS